MAWGHASGVRRVALIAQDRLGQPEQVLRGIGPERERTPDPRNIDGLCNASPCGRESARLSEHLRELAQLADGPDEAVLRQAVEQLVGCVRWLLQAAANLLEGQANRRW
jgi:hypothetical protein